MVRKQGLAEVGSKEWVTSVASAVLATIASQHHLLHMLLLGVGVGGAGAGFMTAFPLLRRGMLLMSLAMTGWTVYQLRRRQRPPAMRLLGGLSAVLSLGLVIWSVIQSGF